MGAWGYKNLENDGAQDLLAEICDDYFTRIVAILRSKDGHEWEEYGHDELFVLIELLIAMSERGMVNSSPEPDEILPLFAPFIDKWGAYHRANGHEPPEDRQKVIEESFAKLAAIAGGASGGSFKHRIGLITGAMSKSEGENS